MKLITSILKFVATMFLTLTALLIIFGFGIVYLVALLVSNNM